MNARELPLPDYDSLPVGSIEARARTLDTAGVRALLDYENEHAGRLQVVQLLRHRLHSLKRGDVRPFWWQSPRPCARGGRQPDPHRAGFTRRRKGLPSTRPHTATRQIRRSHECEARGPAIRFVVIGLQTEGCVSRSLQGRSSSTTRTAASSALAPAPSMPTSEAIRSLLRVRPRALAPGPAGSCPAPHCRGWVVLRPDHRPCRQPRLPAPPRSAARLRRHARSARCLLARSGRLAPLPRSSWTSR